MVIDSHALLWWLERSELLSRRAREVMEGIGRGDMRSVVSAATFWEIRLKEIRGQLSPKRSSREWPGILARIDNVEIEPVNPEIWLRTAELPWDHKDPIDRIVAATALVHRVPVLTKDARFHRADSPVEAAW